MIPCNGAPYRRSPWESRGFSQGAGGKLWSSLPAHSHGERSAARRPSQLCVCCSVQVSLASLTSPGSIPSPLATSHSISQQSVRLFRKQRLSVVPCAISPIEHALSLCPFFFVFSPFFFPLSSGFLMDASDVQSSSSGRRCGAVRCQVELDLTLWPPSEI